MAKYVAYAEFGGDSTHHADRSNLCLIETGNPHVQLTVNKVGGTNGRITHNPDILIGTPCSLTYADWSNAGDSLMSSQLLYTVPFASV